MKKLLFLIAPALLLLAGCQYDDTDVWKELERQKGLISELAQKVENLNSEVQNFKTLVGAVQSNVYVKKIQKNADGYLISFSDGSSITIKDGAPGAPGQPGVSPDAPVIGVKADEDGIYYWTLNGEWILDASGNKMRVAGNDGADGADGVTPLIKYEDPDWMVSYDDGETWEAVPGAQGIGTGITVTTDDENAYFTLADGTVITIPLVAAAVKLQLVFDETAFAVIAPGATASTSYDIVAPEGTVAVIETFEQAGWVVEVSAEDATTGTISITAPADYVTGKVLFCLRTDDGQSFVKIITISAEAVNPLESEYVLDATAGDVLIPVAATAASVSEGADWVTAVVDDEGVTVTVTENDTYEERSATLTVTTTVGTFETVIKQLQNDAIVLSGSTLEVEAEGGEIEIPVNANVDYTAEVTEGADWVTNLAVKGLVEKVWGATVAANEGEARTAKITFTAGEISQVLEISQKAAAVETSIIKVTLPEGLSVRNTYPVFSPDGAYAYAVTRGTRSIIKVDMATGELLWTKSIHESKADNGGDILVNPATGDVICASDSKVIAVTPAGEIKWTFDVPTDGAFWKGTCSATMGSGPTINNDGTVIFAACQDYVIYALNASTGAKIDSYDIETEGTIYQYAVYGDNNIVCLAQGAGDYKGLRGLHFDGEAFSEIKVNGGIGIGMSDITSPVISKDQQIAYFFGGGNFNRCFIGNDYGFQLTGVDSGNSWSGIMAPDGFIYFAGAKNSRIFKVDPSKLPEAEAITNTAFSTSGNNELNFHAISCDEDSNIYFYHNASHTVKKLNTADDTVEDIYDMGESLAEYQGVFNFVGNKLIFGCKELYILTIDATRASGWSGAGGDICATKNANYVWGSDAE